MYTHINIDRALLHAMGSQTPATRCHVAARYKELFDKDLIDVMKSECGNKPFGLALKYLAVPPDVAECHMIHDACKGCVIYFIIIIVEKLLFCC
jgi:hypothetical protein